MSERWSALPTPPTVARVWVQDQTTNTWSKVGTVVEVHPHRQYAVKMDEGGRISLRTLGHLKETALPRAVSGSGDSEDGHTTSPEPRTPASPEVEPHPQRQKSHPRWLEDYIM